MILVTQNLTCRYGSLTAVDSLNISIPPNIIFGLLGPNGAGKSSLIKMLTTLLIPTSGDALIDNESVIKSPQKIRQLIGYVPQLISADGALTGYENLMLFAKLYNIPRKERKIRVNEALELMDLQNFAKKLVSTYSGGMIRRLEVVQAMLHRPKILFLDEPTSGLDVIARANLWEYLLAAHKKFKITVFLTTHDMEEADKLCDEIAIMDKGKISVQGSPRKLVLLLKKENATLEDVFIQYSGKGGLETDLTFRESARQRKINKALGG
jgi:ABC-2 type transport system ATP-binding protein